MSYETLDSFNANDSPQHISQQRITTVAQTEMPSMRLPINSDCRELLLTVTFTGYTSQLGLGYLNDTLSWLEFVVYFMGVFVIWADVTQLRNRSPPALHQLPW